MDFQTFSEALASSINPLMTTLYLIETSLLIYSANHLNCFYVTETIGLFSKLIDGFLYEGNIGR